MDPQMRYLWAPMGRLGTSDEIAPAMLFLCSDDASYIQGADISVDGGQSIGAVPNFGPRPLNAPLFVEDLMAAGIAETGLEDYGDREFVDGLTVLADSLRTEAHLNRTGHMMLSGDVVRLLANRLRFQRDVKRNPEILDVQYSEIRDDARSVIEAVYAKAGREVTREAAAAFDAYESRRPEGHFGKHEYTAERFGLTGDRIAAEFADYYDRFPEMR
jgi:hypothetical protein